ncbi:flagellar biosynthesis anti-sigma factor FlgM [Selenihalanaerobacter shriftii]|uniref:Negative regulator of flagellin synthesis n=1 Tax=Selenihalanaerobacter shriftii TaxID=142842 RepID=A0A1T4KPI4_9FIRM|nr:flagellar biosynthesis anti-sigma factor FlgM [Selenihalanaerobacter shriftii]SJZ44325.1 anti-sigma-28 factor, FlgM family [Selenihalanaerobacter shriftii]
MKISNEQLSRVLKVYNKDKKTNSASEINRKNKGDKLSLSNKAKEMQVAKQALEKEPVVRQEKVDSLKQAIKTGNYDVSGEEVAEKMLARTIIDNLV